MPRFADTVFGTRSGFRRALYEKGVVFRVNVLPRVSVNALDGPVPPSRRGVYIGQRPTWITGISDPHG
ncbi:MAG: hypothetical protein U0599_01330 [Vicinamibacteria bacterium]